MQRRSMPMPMLPAGGHAVFEGDEESLVGLFQQRFEPGLLKMLVAS